MPETSSLAESVAAQQQAYALQQAAEHAKREARFDRLLDRMDAMFGKSIVTGRADKQPVEDTTPKPLRVEVLTFTGDAVDEWLFQMEKYFAHNRVPYDQRMMIVTFHMAGEALKWYQWLYTTHQVSTWFRFAQDVRLRFNPSEYCKPEVMLNLPHQTGLQTSNSHPVKEAIDSLTTSPGVSVETDMISNGSSDAIEVDEDSGESDLESKADCYLSPVKIDISNNEDDIVDVNHDSTLGGSAIVAVTDTEVTSNRFSVDFSSDSVLDDARIGERSFGTVFCVSNTISDLCLLSVCGNASVNFPTFGAAHRALSDDLHPIPLFHKAVVCLNPPWKPPDSRTHIEVIVEFDEWRWQMMSLRVNREVSGSNHPPHSDFIVAVGMARDGAAVTRHGVELELVVSSEHNSWGAFSAGNGDHIETASGYGKMFSAICPTSITRARSMQPFPRFSMGIFVCIGVVQFFLLRSYVATPEPPTEAHDSVAFAKHELCYSYELFYAILIHALDMNEKLYEALLFSPRPTLTPLTYNAWIGACAGNDDLEKSLDVMSRMRRHGFQPDFVNFSSIIQSFTRANTVDSVVWQKLCSEIESDLVECNVHENKPHLELGVAGSITKHGFVVKMYVVNLIIKTLLQNGEISKATEVFRRAGRNGLAVDVVSYDTIMMGFVKNGRVKSALDMFSLMVEKGREPTLLTYDSLIDGFCREGVMQDALTWLDRMRESGLKPDAVMYNALMKCLCDNQEVGGAMKLLSFMLKDLDGVEANMKAFRILIHGLRKEGCLKEAIVVHDQMLARGLSADLKSYNQLIDGFFKVGNIKKVMEFWKQMVDSGFVPDPITYSTTTVLFFKEDHLEYVEEIKEEYAEFYTSLSNACKEQRGMKHFSTKVVLSQVNMNGEEYVTAKEMKLSETVLLQLYFSLDELVSLMCFISKIFLFSLPRPPEMDGRWNEVVANLAFLMRFYNKIFMFSVPRPPEIIDLEDKVKFKGEGMLRIGILRKLRGQVVFCA